MNQDAAVSMLSPDEFWAIYGFGAKVYDATGRRLRHVTACNLETGEVIRFDDTWLTGAWIRALLAMRGNRPRYLGKFTPPGELLTRHGFWPAPLRVEGGRP
jgi:hypothetical protein